MPSYYLSEDLARFPDMGKTQPKLWDLYLRWYTATMEKGALDERTKKLIALATLKRDYAKIGSELEIEMTVEAVRHRVPATVVKTPFFNPKQKTATPPIR